MNSDNTTPPTDTESSSTAVDGSGDAELEDITEKTVEEPDDAELEESPKATVEESGDTELEDITETTVEEPNDAELEESTETAVEESDDAEVEESTETATKEPNDAELEESTETAVEKSDDAELEESAEKSVEKSDVTELEDSIESPTELSEENAKISLAALIVNAQEKSDEQETTTHQELERLLVKVAAKDEELAASNVNIAELQKKLSQAETSAAEKTRDAKADQTSQLNDKLDELASAQIKLVEQLAVANKMASTSSGATQKTVQEEVAKAKIKSFVKKLENRVKTLEGAEEQVKLLRGSLKNLEAKNMEFGAEKEALTKQLEQAAKKIMKSTDMKAELDAATEDYQDSKYQLRELEATLDGMELRQEQTSARARTHQEHRSILASKVRDLEGEIERLTKRLHDMEEDSLRQTPVVAEKKSKKRKPMKKKQSVSSPETDQSFDLDKYLSTVKPDRYVQQLKMVKAAVIAVLAVICASLFGCGTFPADAVMSGSLVCKPTYNTVAWLAGTGGTAELKKARREAEELKTENARLNYLRIEHQRKFIDLEKSVKKERKDIFTEVVGFKKDRDLMDDIWEEEYEGDLRKLEKTIKELQEAQDLACADQAKSENEVEKLPANLDSPLQQ